MSNTNGKKKFRIRITGFETKPAGAFQFNPLNWRRHGDVQRDALRTMLGDVGWVQGVIENKRTGNLIDGHARIEEALRDDPKQLVPYLVVDLSPAEERAVLATLDPIGALAEVDQAALDLLYDQTIQAMPDLEQLLDTLHYAGAGELTDIQDAEPNLDRAAALQKKWRVKRGELFEVGQHRVMCGDATAAKDVDRLLDQARPALMITDPPYGVDYDATWRERSGKNDSSTITTMVGRRGENLAAVLNDDRIDWRAAFKLAPCSVCYVWYAAWFSTAVQDALSAAEFVIRNQIVWRKPNFVISRGHYHWQHEPCWYAVRKGQQAHWTGDRAQSTIWDIASMAPLGRSLNENDLATGHSTQKPVECMARPMRNHAGDVYDPFVGSGTTIIAAEHLGRTCYAMEIDPSVVAVVLERMTVAFPQLTIKKL
jgi:DNA modification methylase